MRKTIVVIIGMALVSCTGTVPQGIDSLMAERDSLKSLIADQNERVTEINKIIAESDSSFEKSLTLVESTEIKEESFGHFFEIYGQVETDKNILLFPESSGVVNSISVKEGQRVSKGSVIASIDSQVLRSQISELETSLSLATTTFEKQERLWNQKIGSEIQFLQAKNQKESLESTISTLQSQLAKSQVRSPFSGVVDEIFPNQGEMANPAMPVARIVNLDRMYIKSEVSESHLLSVKKGTPVLVELPSVDKSFSAEVTEASSYINPENRSFKVRVDLPTSEVTMKPNQLAHIRVNDYTNDKAIVLPLNVVMQSADGQDFVYLISEKDGRSFAKKTIIELGLEYKGRVEVLGGLKPGDSVISRGGKSVREGQRVRRS
jgi:RND family efflux transporter MFP subunit